MRTVKKSYKNTGPMLPGMEISESAESTTLRPLISLPAASPARISALQGNEQALQGSDLASGKSSTVSFASYDLVMYLWITYQLSFTGELIPYSETWPRAGMMRNGIVYELQTSEHPIEESEYLLWPTPTASNPNEGEDLNKWTARRAQIKAQKKNGNGFGMPLSIAVRMWPTPLAGNGNGAGLHGQGGINLQTAVQMFPTPTASPWRSGKSSEATHARNSRPLSEVVAKGQVSGQLSPYWTEWLMGFPIGWRDLEDSKRPKCLRRQ